MYLDQLVSLLVANGRGTFGATIFTGLSAVIPAGDGPFIQVIAQGGQGDEGTHNDSRDGVAYERPSVQVIVRGSNPTVTLALAQALHDVDFNFLDTFLSGVYWRACTPKTEMIELTPDPVKRARYTFSLRCIKRPDVVVLPLAQFSWIQ